MSLILIVEDNADLAVGLRNNLEIEGHRIVVASDGPSGLAACGRDQPDLVILDVMLPGLDGFTLLETIRSQGNRVPVLMLTARGAEADKVRGLRLGADDYVTKPFGVLELLARVEALLRRSAPDQPATGGPVRFGAVEIDPGTRTVLRDGTEVGLTPKEFDLLWALAAAKGRALSRPTLMQTVWGYQAGVLSRTVDTHVLELRRKLERDPARPNHLLTVRSIGYRLDQGKDS